MKIDYSVIFLFCLCLSQPSIFYFILFYFVHSLQVNPTDRIISVNKQPVYDYYYYLSTGTIIFVATDNDNKWEEKGTLN